MPGDGVDERGRRVQRRATGDATLLGCQPDAIAILHSATGCADHRFTLRRIIELVGVEMGDGVDDERDAAVVDDVDDVGTAMSDLAHGNRGNPCCGKGLCGACRRVQGEPERAELSKHGQRLGLVAVGDAAQRRALEGHCAERRHERLVQGRLQVDVDAHDLAG